MANAREGSVKYGWNRSSRDELYDLDNDLCGTNKLIDDTSYSDALRGMRMLLADWM